MIPSCAPRPAACSAGDLAVKATDDVLQQFVVEFEQEMRLENFAHGPHGRVRLHLPEDSPADGALEPDLTVDLEME